MPLIDAFLPRRKMRMGQRVGVKCICIYMVMQVYSQVHSTLLTCSAITVVKLFDLLSNVARNQFHSLPCPQVRGDKLSVLPYER